MLRRVLSLFLAMTLLLSNMPVASFAEQLEVANEDTVIAQSDADLPDGNGNTDESIEIPESVGEDVVLEQQDAPETNESDVTPILGGASDVEAYGTADEDAENEFVSVSGIYLNESEIQLTITDKPIQLLVIIEPENADNQTIAWSSSNPDVADVMAGVVTPLAVGEATVTAVSEDGNFSASCLITVTGSADLETYGEAEDESSIRTSAVNGTWGSQIQWYFDEDTGLLTIGGNGDMPDCNSGGTDAPWYQYKSSIVKVEITDGITAIGENTFRQYTTLEEVTLPDSLVKIGTFAFDGNTKLSSIQLNKVETIGNSAFSNCASLGNVSLDSAKTVGPQAFVSCSALTSVTLGSDSNRVELVGKQAFGRCAALKTVNFKNVKELGEESFTQSGLTSADLSSVEIIGKKAFSADTSLTSVTFGNASIQIGNQAFSRTGLISVDLPGGATLDNYAFYNCASLTEVVLGEGITAIPASCFNGATSLESVTIPVSLQTVGANAFAKCTKLKAAHYTGTQAQWNNVTVSAGNDCLTALMKKGVSLDKTEVTLAAGETVTLTATAEGVIWNSSNNTVATVENGVVKAVAMGKATITATVGEETAACVVTVNGVWGDQIRWYFDEDTGLLTIGGSGDMPDCNSGGTDAPWYQYKSSIVKVEITDGITAIGENTFRQYTTLEEVTLPDSLVKIGTFAFDGNTKLSSIQLNKVETIGNSAFSNCASLGNVSLDSAKTVGPQAFVSCSALTSVTLGSDSNRVELVGKQAFGRCAALKTVNFKNVKELGEESFTQSGLTSADLSSVEIIGKKAFSADTSLTSVTFGNASIQIGNQAFSRTGLISVDLPGGATLDNYAFYNCASLTEVVLGEGITAIPASCFNGATALESVTIPVSLQTVGANAFAKCTKLKAAHYAGTQAQWNNVTVNAGNDCLTALMDRRNIAVTGISLDKAELELKLKDEPEQLVATITPNDATNTSVVWTSNNEKVATVDAVGKVTPIEVGEAVITATTNDGGFQASCKVRVIAADSESGNIDLTKFQFSLYSAEMADSICADISLTVRQTEDGSYALYAPSYAVEYTTDAKSIMVQAPEDFQTPFTVTYTSWAGGVEHEETVHSENGTVNITGYYDGWGKNTSGLVDGAPALKYSDFSFSFEGSSNSVSLSFSLYNSLREIIVENQETYDRLGNITRTDASTYEVHLVRNESYKIYVSGGFRQIFADSNCSISNGVDTQQSVRAAEIIYTPGEETSKDFEIRITSRESSYGIAEGVYKLHIIVDDPPEAKPVFEKYIYTLNGIEYEAVNDSGTYNIPRITQYDKLSIKAVVSNVGDDTVYHWTRWNTALEENEATIKVDTTSSRKDSYQFKCRLTLSSGYEYKLPDICVVFLDIVNIPPPAILTQPVGGEYPIGAQVSLSVLTAYPEEGIPQFQWYSCDDENGSNAQAIKDATDSTRRLDGYLSGYVAPSDEVGTKWYYCEINSYYFNDQVYPKVKTSCVKVEIVKNKLPLDGEGTSDKPYLITSADDLIAIREAVADGNAFVGQHFEFEKDVTLPNDWQPIGCTKDGSNLIDKGNNLNAFSGIIDGAGHTLTIPAGGLPLLGYVWNASVSNLNIYGSQIDGYGLVNSYHGYGLDGTAIVIDNVTLKTGTQTKKAGLIGAELNSENAFGGASASCTVTIRNCTVEDGVVIGYGKDQSMIGAIAGRLHGVIENCKSGATVYGVNYVGGILGCRDNALGLCSVSGCTFDGSVVASGDHAGGIVGGGYTNQTAPNGIKVTANNNTVTGSITGHDKVGGILGGDTYVAQAWNAYSLKVNNFSGTVSATGGKYVGGIIGYYKSLNKWDDILGNTYSNTDKGIGFVLYVDTSCETATGMDGTVLFNSGNGTDGLPPVDGCAWRANHNRTDDPLGADADKLCRVAGGSTEPICYELTASGTYKTEYTVGDELDLTGIVLTASWSNGTTTDVALSDVTVEGYDQNKVGIQTITLKYGDAVAYITVTVKPESVKITVSVSILGDEKHGAVDEPHGLARGGLTAWAEDTSVEADTTETVWDVLQRVAKSKDIELDAFYSEQYGSYYIRGVNGLSEKDNGENSGWMYTVNGKHPEVGVSARFVNENDQIILHYTDDYTYEEDGENYGKEPPVTPKPDKTNATELLSGKSTTLKVLGKNGKVLGKNDITWTLKDPQDSIYATISATGTVKAKTVLTKHDVAFVGTLKGSYEGTVEQVVTILPKVTQVEIVKDGENVTGKTLSLNAVEEETLTLTAKVYPDELAQEVTWKSSNTKIAQIDAEGTVSFAGKTGTVTVTATSTDGSRISATVKLQVGVLTKSVTIGEPADHTLRSGKSLTLKATTDPVKPTVSGVTFKLVNASDSAYVSVSTSGKVSAKTVNEPHVVKIYAVSKDAAAVESKEITLTILPKNVQSLILKSGDKYVTNGKVVRNVNEELTLKAYTLDTTDGAVEETRDVTWTSSNTKVATIDETGKVTCVKTGTVKLTATADKKTKAAVTLKVTNLVNGITIETKNDKDAMVVASGKSLALKATVQPANASQKAVTWSMVSGSRYAKISSSGVVSANKGLTSPVTVTVKAVAKDGSGMEATQEITINPVALGVTISDVNHERTTGTLVWNMTEADNIQFSANVYPVKAVQAVTWKSSNAKIAAVDGTGKVTCYKAGTVTITATAKDGSGKKASFKLNIIKKLKSLTLEDQTVEGGKSLQLKAILDPVDPTNKKLTWTVSSNNVGAKISSSGKLTTKKVTKDTKVMVTVSSNDGTGLTVTCFVTITPSVKK